MLNQDTLSKFKNKYLNNPANQSVEAALQTVGVEKATLNPAVKRRHNFVYSDEVEIGKITDQKKSGRCWMFATLNAARVSVMKKLNVEEFEFSANYTLFFDKLEKANFFLTKIIETADQDYNSRLVWDLMEDPLSDGGYWQFSTGILKKYGAVPVEVMPETYNSENTDEMNHFLNAKLREFAYVLRQMAHKGASSSDLESKKEEQLYFVYTVLVKTLGHVPEKFNFSWRDKDEKFHRINDITPQDFWAEYVDFDLDQITLFNCETDEHPLGEVYELPYAQSVIEADPVRFINLPIDELKSAAIKAIKDGRAVWFACDVSSLADLDGGYLDLDVYNYEAVFGESVKLSKAERTLTRVSGADHAMVLAGVDLDEDGKPITWRVENSWGEDRGEKGVFSMSDEWFDEYVYEVISSRKYVDPKWVKVHDEKEAVKLMPWNPLA